MASFCVAARQKKPKCSNFARFLLTFLPLAVFFYDDKGTIFFHVLTIQEAMNKGLLALALGTFALGIAEFTMMGILGDVAAGLGTSLPAAGHFISAYALGVSVGALFLLFLRRFPLRAIILALAAVIFAGNLFAALAQGYHSLLAARFLSGLPHGCYFGVGAIVAPRLVGPGRGATAVAVMVTGMTVANLVGVPAATAISNLLSWRWTFAIVALFGALTFVAVRAWVPVLAPLPPAPGFRSQFGFLRHGAAWLILGGTFLGQGSVYTWLSYVNPVMTGVAGFSADAMTWVMVVCGCGMVVGNLVSGRMADRYAGGLVSGVIAVALVVVMPLVYIFAASKVASMVLAFVACACLFGIGGPLQYLIVRFARGGEMIGGAAIQIAFNVSNAVSAALGGAVIGAGWGLAAPALAGVPMAAVAAVLLFVLHRRYRSQGA